MSRYQNERTYKRKGELADPKRFVRMTRGATAADITRGTLFRFHPLPRGLRNSVYRIENVRADLVSFKELGPKRAPMRRTTRADWLKAAHVMLSAEDALDQGKNLAERLEGNREARHNRRDATAAPTKAGRREARRRLRQTDPLDRLHDLRAAKARTAERMYELTITGRARAEVEQAGKPAPRSVAQARSPWSWESRKLWSEGGKAADRINNDIAERYGAELEAEYARLEAAVNEVHEEMHAAEQARREALGPEGRDAEDRAWASQAAGFELTDEEWAEEKARRAKAPKMFDLEAALRDLELETDDDAGWE